jgi:hypothetical protein
MWRKIGKVFCAVLVGIGIVWLAIATTCLMAIAFMLAVAGTFILGIIELGEALYVMGGICCAAVRRRCSRAP